MNLLIDSHAAIWATSNPARLNPAAADALADPANDIWFSLATTWELSVKYALGRLPFAPRALHDACLATGFTLLPIALDHVLGVAALDQHHRDPFDRLLIAQARIEGLVIVTHDDAFRPYGVPILWT